MNPKKLLLLLLTAASLAGFSAARAEVVNVAGEGVPAADRPLYANASIYAMIDQNRAAVFHSETDDAAGLNYTLDLGKNHSISSIKIYPRQDACCPERLSNFRVSIHTDGGGIPGAEVWGETLYADGTNPGSGAGLVVTITPTTAQTGRWIKVEALDNPPGDYALQMTELEVYADVPASEVNRAVGKAASANQQTFAGQSANSLVDGTRASPVHASATPEPGYAYTINLGSTVAMSRIVLWPRQDGCCPDRLSNFRVSVLDDNAGQPGNVVWKSDQFTDGSFVGTEAGSRVTLLADADPTGTFRGQWVRIESLENPVPAYALQLSEVQVFGEPQGGTSLLLTQQPGGATAGVGRTATFRIGATAVNGDPAQLTYQWFKNDEAIAGATEAEYTTPPILVADDKAKFKVAISYPGLTAVTSEEATLRVNLAFQADATFNRPLWPNGGWNVGMLVDGNRSVAIHGDQEVLAPAEFTLDLATGVKFENIDIYPRQDGCCADRFRNFRVSIHADNNGAPGDSNWSADLFTDGTDAGSGAGVVVRLTASMDPDPTHKFEGQWIKITSLEDPLPAYSFQVAEIEAYGTFASGLPVLGLVTEPADYGTVPGRTARLSVEAKVVNGNPASIGYQWFKNGQAILGATESTYTTPPLVQSDDGALYRVVLSYVGVANIQSREARVFFDGNYAKNQPATSNRPLWAPGGWNMGMIVDGSKAVAVHADTGPGAGMAFEIDLGSDINVDRIDIYPRQDACCPERLANIRVSIHTDNGNAAGDEAWFVDLFTDGSNAGSGQGVVVSIDKAQGTGTPRGRWVRILALADPVPDYFMQVAEVEVYGAAASVAAPVISLERLPAGTLRINFTGGVLESSTSPTGPWAPVADATSPHVPVATDAIRLYRVRQ